MSSPSLYSTTTTSNTTFLWESIEWPSPLFNTRTATQVDSRPGSSWAELIYTLPSISLANTTLRSTVRPHLPISSFMRETHSSPCPTSSGFGLALGPKESGAARDRSGWAMVGGGVAGAVAAGPLGLAIGLWAGHRWGKKRFADTAGKADN